MIEARGFAETFRHLDAIQDELRGRAGDLYRDIGEIVDDSILANFAAAGRPSWPERKKEVAWPLLNKTGEMGGRALEDTQNWEHGAHIHHLRIRSTAYANYHQQGTTRLPIRKFVQLTEIEIQAVIDRIREAMEE